MELKKVDVGNKGMSQDYSISKDTQEFAFENRNIRIQALDDNTLLSITNIKGPKKLEGITIEGSIVGKCIAKNSLVLFTLKELDPTNYCYIYRIDFADDLVHINTLYEGDDLNFELDRVFDTLFYYENNNVQKVYWTESWYSEKELNNKKSTNPNHSYVNNFPRYINIITEGERRGEGFTPYTQSNFNFYPTIDKTPEFNIIKNYSMASELPAGTIQYFISYYFDNGAETLIANNSSIFTIDYSNRGAKADEVGPCGFDITIKNIDTKFDYFRIYSAIKTSKDSSIILKIVGDYKINKQNPKTSYTINDGGINQETLLDSQLFFIGGTPFYAKTIGQKDDTLFFGNIKTNQVQIPNSIKDILEERKSITFKHNNKTFPVKRVFENGVLKKCYTTLEKYLQLNNNQYPAGKDKEYYVEKYGNNFSKRFYEECVIDLSKYDINPETYEHVIFVECDDITFTYKAQTQEPNNAFSQFYNYRLQTENSDKSYKTFKSGEMYRFGIQFQTKEGQWTYVIWLGDKECTTFPKVDKTKNILQLNTALYKIDLIPSLLQECEKYNFSNYRLVIADPENLNGRRVIAQGVVCPTLFSPGQRAMGMNYAMSSWIMRPKGFKTSHNHWEPIGSSFSEGAEIFGFDYGYVGKTFKEDTGSFDKYGYKLNKKDYPIPYIVIEDSEAENEGTENQESTNWLIKSIVTALSVKYGGQAWLKISEVYSNVTLDKIDWGDTTTYAIKSLYPSDGTTKYYNKKGTNKWNDLYEDLVKIFQSNGLDYKTVPDPTTLQRMANNALDNLKADSVYELLNPLETYKQEIKSEIVKKGFRQLRLTNPYGFPTELFTSIYNTNPSDARDYMLINTSNSILNFKQQQINNEMDHFFVDESIVTFHSPDITNTSNFNALFRIVGVAPIDSTYADFEVQTSTIPYMSNGGILWAPVLDKRVLNERIINSFYSDYLYTDGRISIGDNIDTETDSNIKADVISLVAADYKMYLWDKQGSIPGYTKGIKEYDGKDLLELPSELKTKTFFNLLNSFGNIYADNPVVFNPSRITVFDSDGKDAATISTNKKTLLYNGNYDYMLRAQLGTVLYKTNDDLQTDVEVDSIVRIKYNSPLHAVFDLNGGSTSEKKLLPKLIDEVGFNYNKTIKDPATHIWTEDVNIQNKTLSALWVSEEDIYKDNSWFTILAYTAENIQAVDVDVLKANIANKINDYATEYKNMLLKKYSEGSSIYIGVICDKNGAYIDDIKYLQDLLTGVSTLWKYYLYTININLEKYKDSTQPFTSDCISTLTQVKKNGGLVDKIFIYENSTAYGRFLWECTGTDSATLKSYKGGLSIYKGFPIKYIQDNFNINSELAPISYLFVGELYHNTEARHLYGGYDSTYNLLWYPISTNTPVTKNITSTSGDTYYQRWDCLKTIPKTEEDKNKVVDITSFMVETRRNLDTRTDINRGNFNIMSRPTNFNLFNPVYDFKNNLFLYNTLDSTLYTTEYPNQITWSLKKNFLGKVDSWGNISMQAITLCTSPITKLINYNNQLISLNENSIEIINYNNKNLLASADSTFIELANNSNVDGTTKLFTVYGTHNNSVLITEKGLYFIDDNENSIIRISTDGNLLKLGIGKMDSWFKNNIIPYSYTAYNSSNYHLEYDPIHKDIYIIGNGECLVYNESLDSFTSFVDYPELYTMCNINSTLYALNTTDRGLYTMFEGKYNVGFNNTILPYSIQYRVNPNPYSDKVFTNVEFIADYGEPGNKIFDTILVWDEYLDTGVVPLEFKRNFPSNVKLKFRIWRTDIPRDAASKYKRDRIRNPWINLKLVKSPKEGDYNKMELHNMNVLYML